MAYHPLFKLALLLLLAAPFVLLSRAALSGRQLSPKQSWLILTAMLALTLLVRLVYLRNIELDVDTSTWLSAAVSFDRYPDKIWTLLNYSDSRPLTIFPLIVAHWLGMPFDYLSAEMVGLLLWIGSAGLLCYSCSLIAGRTLALLVAASLCLIVATFSPVYAAYNSEHSSIFLLMLSLAAMLSYVYGRWNSPWLALLTGIVLGSVIYAKFQNVPMGILTGVFLTISMVSKRAWLQAGLLVGGAVLPTLLVNIYYFSIGKLGAFWNAYFWNYFYYSYTTQFSSMPMETRFSPKRVIAFLFFSPYSGVYLVMLGLVILVGFVMMFKYKTLLTGRAKMLLTYGLLLLLLTIYAVLQAGNDFQHYKLYLFPALLLLAAMLFSFQEKGRKYLLMLFISGSLLQTAVNMKYLDEFVPNADFARIDGKVISSINRHSRPDDAILIWGWRDQLHVRTGRAQGYRNVHPFHFSMKSPLIPFWTETFMEDMEANKPLLFIDAMLPDYSERGHLYMSHEKVPVINDYIKAHYQLREEMEGVRIFVRK